MTDKSQRATTIIVSTVLGAIVSGIICCPVWYFVNDNFPPSTFFGHVPIVAGVIGFGFGAFGGLIIGIVVSVYRLRRMASILAGLGINVLLYWVIGNSVTNGMAIDSELIFDSIGQAVAGIVVGLLISVLTSHLEPREHRLQ